MGLYWAWATLYVDSTSMKSHTWTNWNANTARDNGIIRTHTHHTHLHKQSRTQHTNTEVTSSTKQTHARATHGAHTPYDQSHSVALKHTARTHAIRLYADSVLVGHLLEHIEYYSRLAVCAFPQTFLWCVFKKKKLLYVEYFFLLWIIRLKFGRMQLPKR